ncbi:polysaccharide deacetylase family protein [Pseudonocardiaceae bacterium YIM PH 21723]|nr:polysaccharide deacetylase family protein [Pseudonocardiaceae bacterium YIM PH 21723]
MWVAVTGLGQWWSPDMRCAYRPQWFKPIWSCCTTWSAMGGSLMWNAGIGWTGTGYELSLRHSDGTRLPRRTFGGGEIAALTATLAGYPRLRVIVDSTTGLVDASLTLAGFDVYRADPWVLPRRSPSLSADPDDLAEIDPALLAPLDIAVGTLKGRVSEHHDFVASCEPEEDRLRSSGMWLRHGDRSQPKVALTFDDGPVPPYTDQILDTLGEFGVPGTFFVAGLHARAFPDLIDRMAREGHVVANHTWSHAYVPDLSAPDLRWQLSTTNSAIREVTGTAPRLFRPPYGSRTPQALRQLAAEGMATVLWDVDTVDWSMPGAKSIAKHALTNVRNGSVIIMHDGGGDRSQTVAALPVIVRGLLERGFDLVGAHEFAGIR